MLETEMLKGPQRPKKKPAAKARKGRNTPALQLPPIRCSQFPTAPTDRRWLKIDTQGETNIVAMDRHKLIHELGVQPRDLRVLDPKFSTNYPSAILCRDKAIVVNLLHIKAILTTEYVLLVNPSNQDVDTESFVQELKTRLKQRDLRQSVSFPVLSNLRGRKKTVKENGSRSKEAPEIATEHDEANSENGEGHLLDDPSRHGLADRSNVLPFELKALEICLESICSVLDEHTLQLEGTAYPAGDDLTIKVNNQNLQRVRLAKSKNAQLKTRVETVKEILEKFLDDDEDMKAMNLTAKQQTHRTTSVGHVSLVASPDPFGSFMQQRRGPDVPVSPRSPSSSSSSSSVDEDVQEVEMLLEAYFLQLDNTFNRLQALNEYIDSAEDLIIIEQDNHRNQLLRLELIITAGALGLNFVAAIAGLFGMNLNTNLDGSGSIIPFATVTALSFVFALFVFLGVIRFCRVKGLLAF